MSWRYLSQGVVTHRAQKNKYELFHYLRLNIFNLK
jgi:hypothetical protein